MAESFNDFDTAALQVLIEGKGARAGAAEVTAALKSIEAASIRTAKIMEEQLAERAQDKILASARRAGAEKHRLARAAEKAARDESRVLIAEAKKVEQAQIASARKAAQETAKAARQAANEQKKAMKETEGAAHSLRNALIAAATGQVASSIVKTIASYESLKATLVTTTGSMSEANAKFKELQQFAEETPFSVEEAVRAFNHMKAVGLEPTIEKLRAFGDAASLRPDRTFLDFIMAVADGAQGADKRLLDFGINLKKTGDKVKILYGGEVVSTVKNNAKEIEQALMQLSTDKFGGAMERQAKTLAGQWAQLEDKASALAAEIGEGGLLQALKDVTKELTDTAGGGKSVAFELGRSLADGVRLAADAARFLATHLSEVKSVIAGVVAYKAASAIGAIAVSLRTATVAAGGFRAAMLAVAASNPFGWIAIGIALLVELAMRWEDISGIPQQIQKKSTNVAKNFMSGLQRGVDHVNNYQPAKPISAEHQAQFSEWLTKSAVPYLQSGQLSKDAGALWGSEDASPKKKKGGGGGGGDGKKKVDHMAESLSDLRIQSMAAAEAFGLFAGNPEDIKGLEVQNRLLEWRKKLLDQGVSADKIEAMSGQAFSDISAAVDAEAALAHLKDYTEALSGLKQEAKEAEAILGMMQGGADARAIAIEKEVQGLIRGKEYKAEEIARLREEVTLKHAALAAAEDLANAEEAWKKQQEDLAEAQAKALEDSLQRRKDMQAEWVDFAIDGIDKLGDALTNALDGQEKAWRDFFIQLAIAAANLALSQTFGEGGKGADFFGGMRAGVFHSGGLVGAGGSTRSMSASVFFGAQRYHRGGYAGLKPDEVPAILQRGERVLSREETRRGGMRQRSNRNYAININLNGVNDIRGFNRATPALLRRLRGLTSGGDDD